MARKSRKGGKATPKRSNSKGAINILNVAQTYLQTNIITQSLFRTNPLEFFSGQQGYDLTKRVYTQNTGLGGKPGASGSYDVTTREMGYIPYMNGTAITLPELFGMNTSTMEISAGGSSGAADPSQSTLGAVRENLDLYGGMLRPIVQTVVLNAGFTVGKKLMRRQLGIARKGLKMTGLNKVVKV
tara:strand:+ start:59 stop:613 length:555 start_codon:yes stop_codon:yes gene_type:complete